MSEEPNKAGESGLSRESILKAFQEMSDELGRRGAAGEICIFGGTAMVLAFAARPSTNYVDAIFQPTQLTVEGLFEEGAV